MEGTLVRSAGQNTVRFGEFSFDLDTARLYRGPSRIKLEPQPTKLLQRILEARGGIVSREEARLAVWGSDTHVDFDQGLAYGIRRIRRALVDEGTDSKYIETIPREGYRMLAAVEFRPRQRHHRLGPSLLRRKFRRRPQSRQGGIIPGAGWLPSL